MQVVAFFAKSFIAGDYFEELEKVVIKQTGEKIGPIFNCNGNGLNYRVYLVPEKGQWTKSSETKNNISLQVIEKERMEGPRKNCLRS